MVVVFHKSEFPIRARCGSTGFFDSIATDTGSVNFSSPLRDLPVAALFLPFRLFSKFFIYPVATHTTFPIYLIDGLTHLPTANFNS